MTLNLNHLQNNSLEALKALAPSHVTGAIQKASTRTGVDFAYLMQQAKVESSFNPEAKARTSSATGLYQFIKSTWTDMMDKYSTKHGIDTTGKSEAEILELRKDPEIAAKMAAEFARENQDFLNRHWGGDVGSTELYMAHFMGAAGASAFLGARDENGSKIAADLFPAAASANKNVFYDRNTGRAKTLDEVYAFFNAKFEMPEEIERESVVAATAKSYQNPFLEYPKATNQPMREMRDMNAALISMALNSDIPSSYQNMLANPLELMMLTQLDVPFFESRSDEYSIF